MFLSQSGNLHSGLIWMDLGGELVFSSAFWQEGLAKGYVMEHTGADSLSQNGSVEKVNDMLGTLVHALLCSSGLLTKYWSAALLCVVYLHHWHFILSIGCTPFQAWYSIKPNLHHLKMFGSKVVVKHTGKHRAKLDQHDFSIYFHRLYTIRCK